MFLLTWPTAPLQIHPHRLGKISKQTLIFKCWSIRAHKISTTVEKKLPSMSNKSKEEAYVGCGPRADAILVKVFNQLSTSSPIFPTGGAVQGEWMEFRGDFGVERLGWVKWHISGVAIPLKTSKIRAFDAWQEPLAWRNGNEAGRMAK